MHSAVSMSGPIYPRDLTYMIDGDPSSGAPEPTLEVPGTFKVENLQFDLLETNRPDANPIPTMDCDYQTTGARPERFHGMLRRALSLRRVAVAGRHGIVRLTQDAAGMKYHLYICDATNSWQPVMSSN